MESDVRFTVTYNKQPVEVSFDSLDAATVGDLKRRLAELTGVPIENQKLMLKGTVITSVQFSIWTAINRSLTLM